MSPWGYAIGAALLLGTGKAVGPRQEEDAWMADPGAGGARPGLLPFGEAGAETQKVVDQAAAWARKEADGAAAGGARLLSYAQDAADSRGLDTRNLQPPDVLTGGWRP